MWLVISEQEAAAVVSRELVGGGRQILSRLVVSGRNKTYEISADMQSAHFASGVNPTALFEALPTGSSATAPPSLPSVAAPPASLAAVISVVASTASAVS